MKKQNHYYLLVPKNRAKKPTIFAIQAYFFTYKGIKYYIGKPRADNKMWNTYDFETKILICQGKTLEKTRNIAKGFINLYNVEGYKRQISHVKNMFKKEFGISIKKYIKLNRK